MPGLCSAVKLDGSDNVIQSLSTVALSCLGREGPGQLRVGAVAPLWWRAATDNGLVGGERAGGGTPASFQRAVDDAVGRDPLLGVEMVGSHLPGYYPGCSRCQCRASGAQCEELVGRMDTANGIRFCDDCFMEDPRTACCECGCAGCATLAQAA